MKSWYDFLEEEQKKEYFQNLILKVSEQRKNGTVYPPEDLVFNAFEKTPLEDLRVVILGQDPYHGENQAMGLSFSVPKSQKKLPPSLKNIYKEVYKDDLSKMPKSGDLSFWAEQGVFLLNSTLTVSAKNPNSHADFGWQVFTDNCIRYISKNKKNVVFLLWGNFAHKKITLIDEKKHKIITTAHPSPFSAHRGFLGSDCFNDANKYLESVGLKTIQWKTE